MLLKKSFESRDEMIRIQKINDSLAEDNNNQQKIHELELLEMKNQNDKIINEIEVSFIIDKLNFI